MAEKKTEITELSYEEARDELTRVIGELETGTVTLENSMKLWERGEALAKHCEALLGAARAKIETTLKDSAS